MPSTLCEDMAPNPASCPLCNAPTPKATGRTHIDGTTNYTHYGCDSCTVEFWWPLKNPGAEWYSKNVTYGARNHDPVWTATWNHKKTISMLSEHRGKVLDVGCGIGNFLEHAKKNGWECAGIDIDPDAVDSARRKTGISDIEAADVVEYARRHPDKKFDLITFFDVLEHVDNHNEFITSIKSLLKPDGYVAMSMPYREHAMWLMKGDLPPCHLTCWDRESLKRFLEKHGFEITYMRRGAAEIWTLVMKLRFKYGRSMSFGAVNAVRQTVGDVGARQGNRPLLVRLVHALAKTKDAVLFGIPAVIIWTAMLPFSSRYYDLYAIARMRVK
jgi:SAM-dependent methyltransferase